MSRHIDVDAFIADCEQCNFTDVRQVYFALGHQPSIDIVRCRECKKWNSMYCFLGYTTHAPKADDFCSYGERRG